MFPKPRLVLHESIPIENHLEYVGGNLNLAFGDAILFDVAQARGGVDGT